MAKTAAKQQPKQQPKSTLPANRPTTDATTDITSEMPEWMKGRNHNRGSENVQTEDVVIPRLEIVQALSPVCKPGDAAFLPEARPGMLMNSVTRELYGSSVTVVPVFFAKQWLVWKDRKQTGGQGGFFGAYASPQEAADRADTEGGAKAGIIVVDTPQQLCLLLRGKGGIEEIMLSMPRTKAKVSRQWNSMIRLAGGDRFSKVYEVGSVLERNPKGDFYNFIVKPLGFVSTTLFAKAEELYNKVYTGARAMNMDTSGYDENESADDSDM